VLALSETAGRLAPWTRRWIDRIIATTPDGRLSFYWAIESADPDQWPVIVSREDDILLDRYEHSTTEHVYRELADVLDRHSEHNL